MASDRETTDRIDLLVHAAGVEVSRALPDKEAREFDLVHDVKATAGSTSSGPRVNLPIGATVVFSSVAGRFGNAGQTDYSAANDLLCKITSSFRRTARTPGGSLSTGPRGAASAWRPGDRSPRSWRWPASRCFRRRRASPGSDAS